MKNKKILLFSLLLLNHRWIVFFGDFFRGFLFCLLFYFYSIQLFYDIFFLSMYKPRRGMLVTHILTHTFQYTLFDWLKFT